MYNSASFEFVDDAFPNDLVRYKGTLLHGNPRVYSEDIDKFEIREDDVWLCGFMRSGTNWAKEMIWRIANDLSLENTDHLKNRFRTFDVLTNLNRLIHFGTSYNEQLSKLKTSLSPRFVSTHQPFHLLPRQLRHGEKKIKIIYIARNPKDMCVSLYYYYKQFYNFKGNLEEMSDLFIADKVNFAPYWANVLSFWQKRKEFNILFLKYEEMINDLPSVIRKTAGFFGKEITEEQVATLTMHLSFKNYRENPTLNNQDIADIYTKRFNQKESSGYVRKGVVDQWKQEMSADTVRRMDEWIEKNLRNTDYKI